MPKSGPKSGPMTEPTTSPTTNRSANALEDAASPTLITLKMDNAKVEDVMKAISKASGYKLGIFNQAMWRNGGAALTVSVDYDKQPFWNVIADFCQKAQISPYFGGGNRGDKILFLPAGQVGESMLNCPSSNVGAAVLLATQISRQNTVTFGEKASVQNNFEMQLMMLTEPKMRLVAYEQQPILEVAVDDKGNSLIVKGTRNSSRSEISNRQTQVTFGLALHYPDANPGTKITRLAGKIKLMIGTKADSLEFTDFSNAKEQVKQSAGGRRMTLESVKPMDRANGGNNRMYIVKVVIYRDKLNQQQFNEQINSLDLRVTDSRDRELQFQGNRETNNNGTEAHIGLMYRRFGPNEGVEEVGEPVKVAWEILSDGKEITLPFEFKDLPMP